MCKLALLFCIVSSATCNSQEIDLRRRVRVAADGSEIVQVSMVTQVVSDPTSMLFSRVARFRGPSPAWPLVPPSWPGHSFPGCSLIVYLRTLDASSSLALHTVILKFRLSPRPLTDSVTTNPVPADEGPRRADPAHHEPCRLEI